MVLHAVHGLAECRHRPTEDPRHAALLRWLMSAFQVMWNNDYDGFAPKNALVMRRLLEPFASG
ncbi:hypothetical protein CYK37_20615 [Mesorhizobium loti]|nr:hypothetical protein CYK37_20615 [Mesorhizobium loti]